MRLFRTFWRTARWGASDPIADPAHRRVFLTNLMCLVIMALSAVFAVLYATRGMYDGVIANLAFGALFLGILGLNRSRRYRLARDLFLVLVNFFYFTSVFLLGPGAPLWLMAFPLLCVPLVLFDPDDERVPMLIWAAVPVVAYFSLLFGLWGFSPRGSYKEFSALDNAMEALGCFILLFMIVFHLCRMSSRAEKKLKSAVDGLEEQRELVIKSARMAALGEIAGGMAHEINNPLAILLFAADTLRRLANDGFYDRHATSKCVERIEENVNRMARIVRALLVFNAEGGEGKPARCRIGSLVEASVELCRNRLQGLGIELRVVIQDQVGDRAVECRIGHVEQVLVNLIVNSMEAFERMGEKRKRWIRIEVFDRGVGLTGVRVTDNGPGVSPELRNRIFEPFFTTKSAGRGSGLGLSVSSGIAETLGGSLELDPANAGSSFVLTLPISEDEEKRAA